MTPNPLCVLVLGARAPASLEWLYALKQAGHEVWLADSLRYPLARFSRQCDQYLRLPEPKSALRLWYLELERIIETYGIDWVIPTCEETFYLSHCIPHLNDRCQFLTMDFALMRTLHHKGEFAELSRQWSITAPPTIFIEKFIPDCLLEQSKQWVFKPAYSRFATHTLIQPSPTALALLEINRERPWVAQAFVQGIEFCSYSLLFKGKLLAHSLYQPKYRAGLGSGIYFSPHTHTAIETFLVEFGATTGYTGQVGFDFIAQQNGKLWVLECNPRATSGIHLIGDYQALTDFLHDGTNAPFSGSQSSAKMVGLAMLVFGLPHYFTKAFWQDLWRAKDVLTKRNDLLLIPLQVISLFELMCRALRRKVGLFTAATQDIEWDGQPLTAINKTHTLAAHAEIQAHFNQLSEVYVDLMTDSPQSLLVRNLTTRVTTQNLCGFSMPTSGNKGINEAGNCYVVSPRTGYIDYARFETQLLKPRWLQQLMISLINGTGYCFGERTLANITFINNWLLSTNLYPKGLLGRDFDANIQHIIDRHPKQAIGFRSINATANRPLLDRLIRHRFISIPSRQIYLFDCRHLETRVYIGQRHNNKIDAKLLQKSSLTLCFGDSFTAADFDQSEKLYNALYLEKYSTLNPQYTAHWMRHGQRDGWLSFVGLRNDQAQLVGVVGLFAIDDTLSAPIVGYDTDLDASLGLYRLLTQLCIQKAMQEHKLLNFSSGAARFKRLRGAKSCIEYSLVYLGNLSWLDAMRWRLLKLLLDGLGVPLMKWLKL